MIEIRRYTKDDEDALMKMIASEGLEWECYSAPHVAGKYKELLASSITYVALDGEDLCGYLRSLKDGDFYIYVCDLLVAKPFRGQNIGRQLLERVSADHPQQAVFVMSDEDGYYKKGGYLQEGSIFVL